MSSLPIACGTSETGYSSSSYHSSSSLVVVIVPVVFCVICIIILAIVIAVRNKRKLNKKLTFTTDKKCKWKILKKFQ